MPVKGLTPNYFHPLNWTSFDRSSWTQPEGSVPAYMHEAVVYNVNMTNWTVDVATKFDQRVMMDVQVGTPYLHPNSGEGIYCVPEVGSKCIVAIPSDGPPPFVLCFIMPMETLQDTATEEAPAGTTGSGSPGNAKDYTFAGGRTRGKPGDIVARGRDGNFMVLHRGGVAQFGSGPLAQRICVPLNNLVTDISQNYNHFNGGGSINWGVQDRGNQNPGSEYRHTMRVYANDELADIRVDMGRVRSPVPEPAGDAGETSAMNQLGIATDAEIVFEFALAKNGFETDAGEFKGTAADVNFRMILDREGNGMVRFEGSVDLRIKKKLRLTVDDNVEIFCKKNASIQADGSLRLIGTTLAELGTGGGNVVVNSGTKPVASVGSTVKVVVAPGTMVMCIIPPATVPVPCPIVAGSILEGVVMSGNPTILV